MERIARDEFGKALREKRGISVVTSVNGDAGIRLEIVDYGFRMKGMASRRLTPMMILSAKLIDRDGRVLWQDEAKAEPNEMPFHSFDEYAGDAKLIEEAFARAAQSASQRLMQSMHDQLD